MRKESSGCENRENWPHRAEVHIKGVISGTFASSHIQKQAKFLNLGYLVFFNLQKKLLISRLPVLCCKTSTKPAPPPLPPWNKQFSHACFRCYHLGLSPKNFCWIKHNFQPLGCIQSTAHFCLFSSSQSLNTFKIKCSLNKHFFWKYILHFCGSLFHFVQSLVMVKCVHLFSRKYFLGLCKEHLQFSKTTMLVSCIFILRLSHF